MEDDAEASAQRRGDEPRARRRADKRELREVELDRARSRALADHQVELVVLHRGVKNLLDGGIQPVNLVDEEYVAFLQVRGPQRQLELPLVVERRAFAVVGRFDF